MIRSTMTRRQAIVATLQAAGIVALPMAIQAGEQREHKQVTKAGLVRSLMALAVKAEADGLKAEATVIMRAAKELM